MGLAAGWYPTCGTDSITNNDSIRSGLTLVPFDQDLNRLILLGTNGAAQNYRVTWGGESKTFTAQQLAAGVNLATEFQQNPFSATFGLVDAAVTAKQEYETREIKVLFRMTGTDKPTMEQITARTGVVFGQMEKEHAALVAAVRAVLAPVTHTVKIAPLN